MLRGMRIGIEANVWMRRLNILEPFQVAMGGTPLTLQAALDEELSRFQEAGIRPFFVFNGLTPVRKERPFADRGTDRRTQERLSAWDAYMKGQVDLAASLFSKAEKFVALNFAQNIMKLFKEKNMEFMRAPFFAWSQLAYLIHPRQNFLHGCYAGLELLLFGVSRVIIDIDFSRGVFEWVDLGHILKELNMHWEQFVDACLLSGFEHLGTFPPLIDTSAYSFRTAYEMVRAFKTGYSAIQNFVSQNNVQVTRSQYMDLFQRTKYLMRNHIIFDLNCHAEPLNKSSSPSDLHEIIGPRLPNEIFFLLSQGVVNQQVLNNLISGVLPEAPPLMDSEEYRKSLNDLMDIRSKALALVTSCLSDYFKNKKIVTVRWFDPNADIEVPHAAQAKALVQLQIRTRPSDIRGELQRQKKGPNDIGLQFVLLLRFQRTETTGVLLSALENLSETVPTQLTTVDEGLVTILEQGLQLQEYLSPDGRLTPFGKALSQFSRFHEEAMLLLELVRSNNLNNRRLNPIPAVHTEPFPNEKEISLISRVFSVLPMRCHARSWEGPVDLELICFNSILKALHRSLRNLLEMILVNLFLRRKLKLNPHDYSTLSLRLPFHQEPNTALGIAAKSFLLGTEVSGLPAQLPTAVDVLEDLRSGVAFWDEFFSVLGALKDENQISADLYAEFDQANQFLSSKRMLLLK